MDRQRNETDKYRYMYEQLVRSRYELFRMIQTDRRKDKQTDGQNKETFRYGYEQTESQTVSVSTIFLYRTEIVTFLRKFSFGMKF